MKQVFLKKNEERRLLAGHLWIYSNEIDTKISSLKDFQSGELVLIKSSKEEALGIGYINPNTLLCVRLLTKNIAEDINKDFFVNRIKKALLLRELCFGNKPFYRLVFGESDFLPGLVIDRFNDVFVAQLNTAGMENLKDFIIAALVQVFSQIKIKSILLRNNSSIRTTENLPSYISIAYGEDSGQLDQIELEENGIKFLVPVMSGQKTGWFYDQRNNRKSLAEYAKNKDVLDVFSYIGSFGINALAGGAKSITCIDSSEFALAQIKNMQKQNIIGEIKTICNDAFDALRAICLDKQQFDIVIIDPPAFIKRRKDINAGSNAYLRLHRLALKVLKPDGILLTTSCSLHLSRDMLLEILYKALHQENRDGVIIQQLHQSQDHPIHPAIMETDYLKGFIVKMNN